LNGAFGSCRTRFVTRSIAVASSAGTSVALNASRSSVVAGGDENAFSAETPRSASTRSALVAAWRIGMEGGSVTSSANAVISWPAERMPAA